MSGDLKTFDIGQIFEKVNDLNTAINELKELRDNKILDTQNQLNISYESFNSMFANYFHNKAS